MDQSITGPGPRRCGMRNPTDTSMKPDKAEAESGQPRCHSRRPAAHKQRVTPPPRRRTTWNGWMSSSSSTNLARWTARPAVNSDFHFGGKHHRMHKPHTKDLTSSEVIDLRHFLQGAGHVARAVIAGCAQPDPAAPTLMIVIDHHGAKIYRVDSGSDEKQTVEIAPYDPHHFLHHLAHKDQSRQRGQRAPEDTSSTSGLARRRPPGGGSWWWAMERATVIRHSI